MPTKTSKGDHGHPDKGSQGRGAQKATYGSAVSPEVAEGQREAATARPDDEKTPDIGETRPGRAD